MGAQRGAAAGFSRQEGRSKDKTRLCLALVLEGPSIGLQAAAFSQLAKGKNRGLLGTLKTRAKHRRVLRIGRPQAGSSRNVTASGGRGSKGAPRASRDAPTSNITQQRLALDSPRKGEKRAAANERGHHGRRVGIGPQAEEPRILLDGHGLIESTNVEHPQGHMVAG